MKKNEKSTITLTDLFKIFFPFTAFLMMATLTFSYYFLSVCKQYPTVFSEDKLVISEALFKNTISSFLNEMNFISLSIFSYLFSFFPWVTNKLSKWAQLFSLFLLYLSLFVIISPFFAQIIPIPFNVLLYFSVGFCVLAIYGTYKKIEN